MIMNRAQTNREKIKHMVVTAILAVVIVVLQLLCTTLATMGIIPIAPTLALVPILVGTAMYGIGTGAFLGTVFGFIVFIVDPTAKFLMGMNLIATLVLCVAKGALAGAAAGAAYKLFSSKNRLLAIIGAGIVAPVVNTGCFVIGMLIFFKDVIFSWQTGSGHPTMLAYVIFGLCGINFIIELIVNLALAAGIKTIITASQKQ